MSLSSGKSPEVFLGIDPGGNGGIAALHLSGLVEAYRIPDTEHEIWTLVGSFSKAIAVIEQVQGFIGKGHPGSAMFKFGQSYGALRMALTAGVIPFEAVPPRNWQKVLDIVPKKLDESRSMFKKRLRGKAQALFPEYTVKAETADALLLALYCRKKWSDDHA